MRIRDLKLFVFLVSLVTMTCLTMSWWIGRMSYPDLSRRPIISWTPNSSTAELTESIVTLPEKLVEALKRPIFRSTRKPFDPSVVQQVAVIIPPPVPEPAPPAPPPQPIAAQTPAIIATPIALTPPPQFVLKGLAIISGRKSALIVEPSNPDGAWLSVNQTLVGWKLLSVGSNQAKLGREEQSVTLSLYVDNILKPVGSPANSP
jgi:hypothetical protein